MTTDGVSNEIASARGELFPPALLRRTGFLLSVLGRRTREATEQALAPLRIKPHHYGVLVLLEGTGPLPQHTIGTRLGIDKSTMTVVGDHLEALGLVERRRNPANRRAYEFVLTDTGRSALATAEPLIAQIDEEALAPLDPAERTELHDLLLRLVPAPDP
jgi:DNA-binding MarR family transcriptional regulator